VDAQPKSSVIVLICNSSANKKMNVEQVIDSLPIVLLNIVFLYAREVEGILMRRWDYGEKSRRIDPPFTPSLTWADNLLFIVDAPRHCILRFDSRGTLVGKIGRWGSRPGEFLCPSSVACHNNVLYVVDWGNNRIQVLQSSGNFMDSWPTKKLVREHLFEASKILLHHSTLYLMDNKHKRVQILRIDGTVLQDWTNEHDEQIYSAEHEKWGANSANVHAPYDMAVEGDVFFFTDYWLPSKIFAYSQGTGTLLDWVYVLGEARPCIAVAGDGAVYTTTKEGVCAWQYKNQRFARGKEMCCQVKNDRVEDDTSVPIGLTMSSEGELFVCRSFSISVWC